MKYRFGEVVESSESRARKIRALFISGTTIKAHTEKCISARLWTESELRSRAARACANEVRDALGVLVDGLPFAGPTAPKKDDGLPVWKQMELWTQIDFVYNFNAYARRGGENIAIANNIAAACIERFGTGANKLRIVEEFEDEPVV